MKRLLRYIGYDIILNEIPPKSRILDLGCGDGDLLAMLYEEKEIEGAGVEISEKGVSLCVEKGLYCYQGDIDEGLSHYKDNSFDYVILNQTIQNTKKPEYVLNEVMRIGKHVIISFPNFGYLTIRLQLLLSGSMPKTQTIPFNWYESPNIHMVTIKDFREYCKQHYYPIKREHHFNMRHHKKSRKIHLLPNLRAMYGFVVLDGTKYSEQAK
jgi:methionine biosynthesis protein MetW